MHAEEKNKIQEQIHHADHENALTKSVLEKKYNLSLGKNKYESAGCAGCHDNGILGAPKPGHKDSWVSRVVKGWGNIVNNAVSGFNKMPPKGGNESISQSDIENIIAYMIS
ncbi:MAG: c-type cytochrome [Chlorobiales bacterium]|nr:c-type cytochrome [Chlorobiales bacterium]